MLWLSPWSFLFDFRSYERESRWQRDGAKRRNPLARWGGRGREFSYSWEESTPFFPTFSKAGLVLHAEMIGAHSTPYDPTVFQSDSPNSRTVGKAKSKIGYRLTGWRENSKIGYRLEAMG